MPTTSATGRPRVLRAAVTTVLAVALVASCSTNSNQPPALGNCVPEDGGTCGTMVGGSSGSGGSSDGGSCSGYADASACDACAASSCCTQLLACSDSTACANLDSCETACGGVTSCLAACQSQYPMGVGQLTSLFDCLTNHCPVCAQSGVGDPCAAGYPPCQTGLTCNGDWCTKACVHSSDCPGLGTGGTNDLGEPNSCMITATGYFCSPGCASPTGCADYPGTFCQTTTSADHQAVSVCSPLFDASVAD